MIKIIYNKFYYNIIKYMAKKIKHIKITIPEDIDIMSNRVFIYDANYGKFDIELCKRQMTNFIQQNNDNAFGIRSMADDAIFKRIEKLTRENSRK